MKKLLLVFLAIVVLAGVGFGIFLASFDTNNYRTQIAEELSQKTGRKVSLTGQIKLGLSLQGVTLSIQDAAIGNAPWAAKSEMAGIGRFEVGLSVPPLLSHKIVVTSINLVNADIDLESSNNQNNWELFPSAAKPVSAETATPVAGGSTTQPMAMELDKLLITDSQVTYRNNGVVSIFKVSSMELTVKGGAALKLTADFNGTPLTVNITSGAEDLLPPRGAFPFTADISYANYKVTAEGKADLDKKEASIAAYKIISGGSTLFGAMEASWAGAKPLLKGTMDSASLTPSDFAAKTNESTAGNKSQVSEVRDSPSEPQPLFTTAHLNLDGLKAVNADLKLTIAEVVLKNGTLKDTEATVLLSNGLLSVAPFKTTVGNSLFLGQVKVAASSPPVISVIFKGDNIDLQDVLKFGGAPSFISGKGDLNVDVAATGNSTEAMASSAVGVINLIAAGGTVSSAAAKNISSSLMQLFAPGGSNALNCIAARFILKNGVAQDNGILVDTSATTVLGKGGFNLGQETLDLTMRAKAKESDIGDLLPAARIEGTFQAPHFAVDPAEVLKNVAGLFSGAGTVGSPVPTMLSAPGQNACVYTIEHPVASTATTQGVLPPSITGKAGQTLNNVSGLLKGFLSH